LSREPSPAGGPPKAPAPTGPLDPVLAYHERSKHHFGRYARSLGYLDWSTQPDPFRRYAGAPLIRLRHLPLEPSPSWAALHQPGAIEPAPVGLANLSRFFKDALALSAWKAFGGERWALRVNPSSGNLHPTEGYLLIGAVEGLHDRPAVYHYAPAEHGLELRAEMDADLWRRLVAPLPEDAFLAGLSSIHWREAWKYGERAYRYCHQDIGHALGTLRYAAALLGWKLTALPTPSSADVARLIGLEGSTGPEAEEPELLAVVHPGTATGQPATAELDPVAVESLSTLSWTGEANVLSPAHVPWEVIEEVAEACRKPRTAAPTTREQADDIGPWPEPPEVPARLLIHRRRSAVAMDGRTGLPASAFWRILAATLPGRLPFDAYPWPPAVHLLLFVHRVAGVSPGVYIFCRRPTALADLRRAARGDFTWEVPPGTPEGLPLYCLIQADVRAVAARVSCLQDIAGDGVFSLGMLAEFEEPLRRWGAWFYPRLHWECGLVGQTLYLEAEAAGLQATGIGCFFDDPVHRILGLTDRRLQSLYHFAVGGAVIDRRLTTLPPYEAYASLGITL